MVKRGALRPVVVEFTRPLTVADVAELRSEHGLALDQYVRQWAYIERLEPEELERLREDPRVRALRPHDADAKLDRSIVAGRATDNAAERHRTAGAVPAFRATLFDDADPAEVGGALRRIGARDVLVFDDRPAGGRSRVQFALDDPDQMSRIATLDDVVLIEPISPIKGDSGPEIAVAGAPAEAAALWERGLHGEAQIIGLIDNGPPDLAHCFFADVDPNQPGPEHRKVVAVRNDSGTPPGKHATFVAGCAAGDEREHPGANQHRGGAWAARLVCGNRNDLHTSSTVFAELAGAMEAGAFIHSNSWHFETDGGGRPARYTQDAADVDAFTFRNEDHLVLGSAGNSGEEQGPPGTAKNALCVAAAKLETGEPQFGDGNRGPTADGRRKPDLVAAGCDLESALQGTGCGSGRFSVIHRCATSFATPRAAAAAALVRQYFTEGWHPSGAPRAQDALTPTGALLKAVLLNSTVGLGGDSERPSDLAGWGLVAPDRTLAFADLEQRLGVWDVRHATGVTAGEKRAHHLDMPGSTAELRVTLVWTDPPPAAVAASSVAVNRLGLEVMAPDGTSHSAGDSVDPVQMVAIPAPGPGDWKIEVDAIEVNVGSPGQGYALVATTRPM